MEMDFALFNHWEEAPSKSEMIDWLREAHAYFAVT